MDPNIIRLAKAILYLYSVLAERGEDLGPLDEKLTNLAEGNPF